LGETDSFGGDRIWEDHIKRGEAVGGDKQDVIVDFVDIPDFAFVKDFYW
jgi:hypothetical protein